MKTAENLAFQSGGMEVGEKDTRLESTVVWRTDADFQKSDLTKCLKTWAGIEMLVSFGLAGSISDQREKN